MKTFDTLYMTRLDIRVRMQAETREEAASIGGKRANDMISNLERRIRGMYAGEAPRGCTYSTSYYIRIRT